MPGYQLCSFQNLTWCELMINKKGAGVPEQLPNACILRFNECPRWVKCVPLYNLQCRWVGVTKMPQCCVPELWLLFCREILTLDCGFVQPTDWQADRPTDEGSYQPSSLRLYCRGCVNEHDICEMCCEIKRSIHYFNRALEYEM